MDFSNDTALSNGSCVAELYGNAQFTAVAAVRSLVALFSLLCSVMVVSLVCCCKKYRVSSQRLILGLAVISAMHSLVYGVFRSSTTVSDISCLVLGFAELYCSWVELMLLSCMMVYLLLLVVGGRELSYVVQMLLSFLLPLTWCWVPFLFKSFGAVGPWCGIRAHRSDEDCGLYTTGVIFRFILWQIPLFGAFSVFFLVCFLLFFRKLRRDSVKWEAAHYEPKAKEAKKIVIRQLMPLLSYPVIYLLLKFPLLLNQIYEAVHPESPVLVLWLLDGLTSPLAGAVIALVYACDKSTLSKVKLWCRSCSCCYLPLCRSKAEEEFHRSRSSTKHVVDYSVGVDTVFGDSMDGQKAKVALQKATIEQRLAAKQCLTKDCRQSNTDHRLQEIHED